MAHAPTPLRSKARFGPFVADLRTAELRKYDLRIKLAGRPFSILAMLLENPGQVVTRDEIRSRLWSDGTFVDFENNINSAIGKLRAAVGDSAVAPRYIETAARGYRLMAEVEWLDPEPPRPIPSEITPSDESPVASSKFSWKPYAALAAVLVVAVAVWWFAASQPRSHSTTSPARVMIAVLPFQNLTGESGQEYLTDGLTEEVITQLGNLNVPSLGVIARTSVMYYKNGNASLEKVRHDLGVQYVMEGSVRREGDQVRVTAQLIELDHQSQVWSRQYDRKLQGLLTLQDEIAGEIAHEVQRTFADREASSRPAAAQDYGAYDLYLKGQYFFNQRTAPGLQQAVHYFEAATAKDPKYARAYASLAASYVLLPGYLGTPQTQTIDRARSAALRALQLDPNLAEAHAAYALILEDYDWDWINSEKEFQRAIQLNPSYATAHHWYAEHLAFRGRFEEALAESEQARRLDPLSLIIASDKGAILYYSRKYDQAIEQWRSVLELDPNFPRAHLILYAYVEEHRFAEAFASTVQMFSKDSVWFYWQTAYVHGRAGQTQEARQDFQHLLSMDRQRALDPRIFAEDCIAFGDYDRALNYLEQAAGLHSIELTSLKVNPVYDPLRSHLRFQQLLVRVHLADAPNTSTP